MRISNKIVLVSALAGLLLGCGGGGGADTQAGASNSGSNSGNSTGNSTGNNTGNTSAPSVSITSPRPGSMVASNIITVNGTATDADGVSTVVVNGLSASTSDEFATWTAQVPLREGANELVISATDTLGNNNAQAARLSIERGYLFDNALSVVLDVRRRRAIMIESGGNALLVVDSANQTREEFSGANSGSGPRLVQPQTLFLDPDNDRVVVFDAGQSAVLAVQLEGGERSLVSADDQGAGPSLNNTNLVAANPERSTLFALSASQLIQVDLTTGNRTGVTLSGTSINDPRSARLDSVNNRLLVSGADNIYSVNVNTGASAPMIGAN